MGQFTLHARAQAANLLHLCGGERGTIHERRDDGGDVRRQPRVARYRTGFDQGLALPDLRTGFVIALKSIE